MATPEQDPRWDKIVEDLQGTCATLTQISAWHDAEDLEDHMPFLEYLDGEIFRCATCGWWCEMSEMAEDDDETEQVCTDCSDQEEN